MNYYDELIENIDKLLNEKEYDKVQSLIINELNLAYVPKDIENKLNDYLSFIKDATYIPKSLTDEDIESYLYKEEEFQLIAVDELDRKNLRDYIEVCSKYLKSNGFKNAKALLIDSLIKQEINHEFDYIHDDIEIKFNPRNLKIPEQTEGYVEASKVLNDVFLKDPSMLKMGMDLLYKECLLYLPKQADANEGSICARKIIKYITDAFNNNK